MSLTSTGVLSCQLLRYQHVQALQRPATHDEEGALTNEEGTVIAKQCVHTP